MDTFTTEIVRSLFGHNIGPVLSSHVCSLHRQSGRMYISSNAVCFYSNMFGFERKIMIHFSNLQYAGLKRTTSIVLRSKCEIKNTSSRRIRKKSDEERKEESEQDEDFHKSLEEHVFRSFDDRQSVLDVILDAYYKLHGHSLTITPEEGQADENEIVTPLRKRFFSDGSYFAKEYSHGGLTDVEEEETHRGTPLERSFLGRSRSGRDLIKAFSEANKPLDISSELFLQDQGISDNTDVDQSIHTFDSQLNQSLSDPQMIAGASMAKPIQSSCEQNISSVSMEEWKRTKQHFVDTYPEIVAEVTLPISLSEYYGLFIKDEAPFSMAWFQQHHIGDENVQCPSWTKECERPESQEGDCYMRGNVITTKTMGNNDFDGHRDDSVSGQEGPEKYRYKRSITSLHKRKAKIGPSRVSLERNQIHYLDTKGIVLNTVMVTRGIPYEKNFQLEDQWIIEQCSPAENDNNSTIKSKTGSSDIKLSPSTKVQVRFRIHFIKSTMTLVKKMILDQTKKEVNMWFEKYISMIHSKIKSEYSGTINGNGLELKPFDDGRSVGEAQAPHKAISTRTDLANSHCGWSSVITIPRLISLVILLAISVIVLLSSLIRRISFMEKMLLDITLQNEAMVKQIDSFASGKCGIKIESLLTGEL